MICKDSDLKSFEMYERTARSIFALLVVVVHVLFVSFCAVYLQDRITRTATYLSTMAVFLPVFGIYVGVVVKSLGVTRGPRGRKVSNVFTIIMFVLFLAYVSGNIFVVLSFDSGFISSEDMLPGAIAVIEAAFGGFFTTMFLSLFGQDSVAASDN